MNQPINECNDTLLHLIIRHNYEKKSVKYLLENGSDPNIYNYYEGTPLHLALYKDDIRKKDIDIVQLLLDYDANPNLSHRIDNDFPLNFVTRKWYCHFGSSKKNKIYVKMLQLLLNAQADPNIVDKMDIYL